MKVRFYVAPQQGDGTFLNPYRSILNDLIDIHAGDWFDEIDNPARHISICCVHASDASHAVILADARAIAVSPLFASEADIPNGLNTVLNSIPGIATIKTKLEANGINMAWISGSNTLKDAIRYLVKTHTIAQIADGLSMDCLLTQVTPLGSTVISVSENLICIREGDTISIRMMRDYPDYGNWTFTTTVKGIPSGNTIILNNPTDGHGAINAPVYISLRTVGGFLKQFALNNLDTTVNQVPQAIRTAIRNWMQSKGLAIGWITNATTVREILHFIVSNLGIGKLRMSGEEF